MKLSVVIPMYNEKTLCLKTADELTQVCRALPYESYEILFSDDGSLDGCRDLIAGRAEADPCIRLVHAPADRNRGKGSAVRLGVLASTGDTVLFTDCDLAYGTEQITTLLAAHEAGHRDLTVGSRARHENGYAGYSFLRRLASHVYHFAVNVLSGLSVSDSQTGIKAFRGDAARAIFARCETNGFAFDLEALMVAERLSYTVLEFPVCVQRSDATLGRKSRVRLLGDSVHMLRDILRIRKRVRHLQPSKTESEDTQK